ncbi:FtsX-like permease family protein [Guyparkeria hydrothermalis]|uniref:ABC transporter permease n=1 Tax=Guyparkeria hydrothermalis TaxID=923 RepID=UPI0020217606|nr:FtsX-like permease family protein [Guyparkeria hydrothermalis]MCL7744846.1 FtsX-like permease family protein [Guyparkeria hydrothermalis]
MMPRAMRNARLAWQGLVREVQSGLLTPMLLALLVAVSAVTAVGFFVDRVDGAMRAQAAQFLAADARVESPDPLDEGAEAAADLGLTTSRHVTFPTVVLAGQNSQLVGLKAVDGDYPLRGDLRIDDGETVATVEHGPPPGEVWLARRALLSLDAAIGDSIAVGQTQLTIAAVLEREPDVGNIFAQAAPRLMIHRDDLAATGLVTDTSRVEHSLLLASDAGDRDARLDAFAERLPERLRLERPESSQPAFETAFDRAARFLGLASVVAVLLAGAALVIAARHYNRVQQGAAALMRAMGASSRQIGGIYRWRLLMLALLAAIPGIAIGAMTQLLLADLMAQVLDVDLPAPGLTPVALGLAVALVALFGFALPSLVQLKHTPPLRVLVEHVVAPSPAATLLFGAGIAAITLLVWFQARDAALTLWVTVGLGTSLLVFLAAAWLLVTLLRRWPARGVARFGLARMARARWASATQIAALALGVTAVLLLSVVRSDLIDAWERQIPADAPSIFAINIQPEQVDGMRAFLDRAGIENAGFYPMVRARWTEMGEEPVDKAQYEGRAHRLATREFNLSVGTEAAAHNRVTAGDLEAEGFSVEEGIAETLGWSLGDRLTFTVDGRELSGAITSLRAVDWDSMRPNFFVIASPALMDGVAAQYITSFHFPDGAPETQVALLREFPTVTLFDVSRILDEVRTLIDRASQAVEYVFAFTLAAGLVVLLAAFGASERQRIHDAAVLRVMGASRAKVVAALWIEFLALGLLVGLLAAVAAMAVGATLSARVFDLPLALNPSLLLWGLGTGLLLATIVTPLLGRRMTRVPPARALQR